MADALIGHTGFVGGNLLRQRPFDECFHSQTIRTITGRRYDLLVCSGAPAEKWRANQEPERDWANLQLLMDCLDQVEARQAVLISTIDVYPDPVGVDERTPIDPEGGQAYGRHRYALERFMAQRFPTLILRLPGLFGQGLKKNAIFDLIHNNRVEYIVPTSRFQFYSLDHLWRDIERFRAQDLSLVNVATEPISMGEIAREVFGVELNPRPELKPARYDFQTIHAGAIGRDGPYVASKAEMLAEIGQFVAQQRGR